jgi:hypothetical protein
MQTSNLGRHKFLFTLIEVNNKPLLLDKLAIAARGISPSIVIATP